MQTLPQPSTLHVAELDRLSQPGASQHPLRHLLRAPERKRLDAALGALGARLAAVVGVSAHEAWAQAAVRLYARAEHEARSGDLDSGWKFLHEAERQAVHGLSADQVDACLARLSRESGKLSGWRQAAVRDLLGKLDDARELQQRQTILAAVMCVRDEHSDNVYYRHRLLRRQMTVVSLILMLLGGAFFAVLHVRPLVAVPLSVGQPLHLSTLLAALTMGGMGACFSALTTFATSSAEMSIPGHLANVVITMTRPLIGAVSGLVAVLLLHSGVVDFGRFSLLVPFAFGFSERLVMGVLAKVAPAAPGKV
jgi:hypothetical protein